MAARLRAAATTKLVLRSAGLVGRKDRAALGADAAAADLVQRFWGRDCDRVPHCNIPNHVYC